MLLGFFEHLRRYQVPVSLKEYIDLLALMRTDLVFADQDDFYFFSRLALVKDEKFYDRFDCAFAAYFEGIDRWVGLFDDEESDIRQEIARQLVLDGKSINVLHDYQETIRQMRDSLLLESLGDYGGGEPGRGEGAGEGCDPDKGDSDIEGEGQKGVRGEGVSETGEAGERTDEVEEKRRRANKVWLDREFADYDPDVELGTRNLKMALRGLRRWAREAADLELDLLGTISATARNGGILDIVEIPERRNAVKVLMLYDVGGSMDQHIELCSQLFSAACSEFKRLDCYYFHNFLYENIWRDNQRRFEDRVSTWDLIRKYSSDHKVIMVGDAEMGQWEIIEKGGSVEHFNAEPGEVWLKRLREHFRCVVWINPVPEKRWQDSLSIKMINKRLNDQMYYLSDAGLAAAMNYLMR